MPRKLTSRPTKNALVNLEKKTTKAFTELVQVSNQLTEWGGAAEKIVRWRKDLDQALIPVQDVLYSMRLILKGDESEPIDDEEYSFE